jgi:hypothetical protein
MKNAATGATYMTTAKIARIAARTRRWFVADNAAPAMVPRSPIPIPELIARARLFADALASVPHVQVCLDSSDG